MSETYTTGGDALYLLDLDHIAGQIFNPKENHVVEYIDLNLHCSFFTAPVKVQIYKANEYHEPIGEPLARAIMDTPNPPIPATVRSRVKLITPTLLYAGWEHVLLVFYEGVILGTRASWQYDQALATYPRGHRIHSEDNGLTWTHEYDQDHIFCEFGDPPLPMPEPPPPIEHFAALDLSFYHCLSAVTITLATSVPCHLTCYYTDEKPLKHHTERTVRGLTVPWATYFCFVAWKEVDQSESGDSLYHTFKIPEWIPFQPRWLTFRGNIDEQLSPSIGPIFNHCYDYPTNLINTTFGSWTDPTKPPPGWYYDFIGSGPCHWDREEIDVKIPPYAAKLSSLNPGTGTYIIQKACAHSYRGKTLKFEFWFKFIGTGNIGLSIQQTGPGSWDWTRYYGPTGWLRRSVTHYIDPNAHELIFQCRTFTRTGPLATGLYNGVTITEV